MQQQRSTMKRRKKHKNYEWKNDLLLKKKKKKIEGEFIITKNNNFLLIFTIIELLFCVSLFIYFVLISIYSVYHLVMSRWLSINSFTPTEPEIFINSRVEKNFFLISFRHV